jgi:glycosyltransferase involved in cell wall biosynthesis
VKALIAADLAPSKIGSLECQIFAVARMLETAGIHVTTSFAGAVSQSVSDHFDLKSGRIRLRTGLGSLASAENRKAWLRHVGEEKPDILWLHFFPPAGGFLGQIRRASPEAAVYFTDHVSRGYDSRGPLKRALCRVRAALCSRQVDCYIAVSRFVARRLEVNDFVPAAKIRTVYNGVDLARFHPTPQAGRHIAAICNMIPQKGVQVLLQALVLLKQRGVDLACQLVGVGPHLDSYREFVRDNALESVTFLGRRDDVQEIVRLAQLTVVPSVWEEAFGLAAAESMAAGVPVIASNVGALPEIVDDKVTGLLVPPGDAQSLAAAIAALTSDPERRRTMGRRAREKAEQQFDSGKQNQEIADILLSCVPSKQPLVAAAC